MSLHPASTPDARRARGVLSLDSGAALTAGVLMLALARVLAPWYQVEVELLHLLGVVNLVYGVGSGALAMQARRALAPRRRWVELLIAGNLGWAAVCAGLIASLWGRVGPLAYLHLAFEGTFVAVLAVLERRWVRPWARP